jgi:predicted nucleic acid-binding protein
VVYLLDANLLIALTTREHLSRARAIGWFLREAPRFATCPITQGALLRFHLRETNSLQTAKTLLKQLVANPQHEFWPDDCDYFALDERGLQGHKQLTDFYLAALARSRGATVATLDDGLAICQPDACVRI